MKNHFGGIYRGKRVFLTGHTGFKGSWLAFWLSELGAEVHGYALDEPNAPASYTGLGIKTRLASEAISDLRDLDALRAAYTKARPAVVFHMAAQPLVRYSYAHPLETLQTNFMGTAHVLEAMREAGRPCGAVFITSDKCYRNEENARAFCEQDPMGGKDIYSMSKGACELLISAYRDSFFPVSRLSAHGIAVASARAGNVIGGGDYADDRLIPDCVRALVRGEPVRVRNPRSRRPWQHVFECLSGYLVLGSAVMSPDAARYCAGYNFGPQAGGELTVEEMVTRFLKSWGSGEFVVESEPGAPAEAATLALDVGKAERELGWRPAWDTSVALDATARWYRQFEQARQLAGAMTAFSREQIKAYVLAQATQIRLKGSHS